MNEQERNEDKEKKAIFLKELLIELAEVTEGEIEEQIGLLEIAKQMCFNIQMQGVKKDWALFKGDNL